MQETENESALALWGGRLALSFLIGIPLSIIAVRVGMGNFTVGLGIFALCCLGSLLLLLVLAIASMLPRYRSQRKSILLRSLPALPPVLLAGALLGASGEVPAIHDITTDTVDPPVFSAGAAYRGKDSNPLDIVPEVIAMQREAYPDIATLITPLSEAEAFARAGEVAEQLNWDIYNSDPSAGLIEAEYTSFFFGYVDDVVIRIRPAASGTKVDLRSVSRVGVGDLGANAKRIRAFVNSFEG